MKISIIGCGNIGRTIIKAVSEGIINCEITGVFDINDEGFKKIPEEIPENLKLNSKFTENFSEFLQFDSELVIEAASQKAVQNFALNILNSNKNLMIMSIGALVDKELFENMKKIADENNLKIYIPSGAVVGLDGIAAAKIGGINEVMITTRKSPGSLGIKSSRDDKERIIYEGFADEAVKLFPKNVNVAAAVSLAGIGFEKTKVRIIADPKVKNNIHEIHVKGAFGEIKTRAENVPSPDNPKTSYLASLSAIATIKKIAGNVRIGG